MQSVATLRASIDGFERRRRLVRFSVRWGSARTLERDTLQGTKLEIEGNTGVLSFRLLLDGPMACARPGGLAAERRNETSLPPRPSHRLSYIKRGNVSIKAALKDHQPLRRVAGHYSPSPSLFPCSPRHPVPFEVLSAPLLRKLPQIVDSQCYLDTRRTWEVSILPSCFCQWEWYFDVITDGGNRNPA